MSSTSANNSVSIFKDGKLKPGIYKIQNIVSHTYVDMREDTRQLCCRPATVLEGKGLWEILPSGPGYTIRRVEPGKPEYFCIILEALRDGSNRISVGAFPVAWRLGIVDAEREHVRFFWGTTNLTWDLHCGSDKDLTPIHYLDNWDHNACRIWKLVPVELYAAPQPAPQATSAQTSSSGPLPPYDENPENKLRCTCTCSHRTTETSDGERGTTVVEVTVTTVAGTKKYRIESD